MLVGKTVSLSSPQGRFDSDAAQLDGRTCLAIDAYGKHLVYQFEGDANLHVHLGLYGRFRTTPWPVAEPRGAVRVRMVSNSHVVDINGPNTCEVLDGFGLAALTTRIGPDVLRADAEPQRAFVRICKSRSPIGQLMMDQSVMAGIGNIYRSEILWRQRIHPDVAGRNIDEAQFAAIWSDAVKLLAIGVQHNAIITVEKGAASKSRYRERVNIFGKQNCPRCQSAIRQYEMAGRRVFVCDDCQRLSQECAGT